jgi:hypothetical protein
MTENALGAMFEVLVDGKPRSYRITRLSAWGRLSFSSVEIRTKKSRCGICKPEK